jgi:hypothetical protein
MFELFFLMRITIYRACNFKYYGLTEKRSDFWIKQPDGSFIKHSRGKTKGVDGEWRERSRKHRFLLVYDRNLTVLWKEVDYKKYNESKDEWLVRCLQNTCSESDSH